ncbi:UNVERIFIED_CONTAM: hypothetical protein FKN15_077245 [Acipenser sinensis]
MGTGTVLVKVRGWGACQRLDQPRIGVLAEMLHVPDENAAKYPPQLAQRYVLGISAHPTTLPYPDRAPLPVTVTGTGASAGGSGARTSTGAVGTCCLDKSSRTWTICALRSMMSVACLERFTLLACGDREPLWGVGTRDGVQGISCEGLCDNWRSGSGVLTAPPWGTERLSPWPYSAYCDGLWAEKLSRCHKSPRPRWPHWRVEHLA